MKILASSKKDQLLPACWHLYLFNFILKHLKKWTHLFYLNDLHGFTQDLRSFLEGDILFAIIKLYREMKPSA